MRYLAPDDAQLLVEGGDGDPEIETAPLEGVVDLARAVRGDDDRRRFGRADRADFRNGDLPVAEQLEQKRFELLVGAIDLVDQQHRRAAVRRVDGPKQRSPDQE